MMKAHRSLVAIPLLGALLTLSLPILAVVEAEAAPPNAGPRRLFRFTEEWGDVSREGDLGVKRSRRARLNLGALEGTSAVDLELFDDVTVRARRTHLEHRPKGYTWVGTLEGRPSSHAIFAVVDGVVAGSISWPGTTYSLAYAGEGIHVLQEIDPEAFPDDGADFVEVPLEETTPASPAVDDGTMFDLLVVYTPAARAAAGGTSAMESRITLGATETNTAYANSNIIPRLRLVATAEVSYTESGSLSTDLSRFRGTSDGYMDGVHALRDTYGADLVHLVVESGDACGIAYLMSGNNPGFAPNAFSVGLRSCISPNYTFAHELGHNMGCNHARPDPTGAGAYSYSYGYKDPSNLFRTVMAYNCPVNCSRVLHFSNPAVLYNGQPTGIDENAPDSAHNALSINNVRVTVANWRVSVAPTLSINDVTVNEGNAGTVNAVFTVTLSQSSDQTVTVSYATANGTASAPSDYQSTSGSLTFQPQGALTQTVAVHVNGDGQSEASETFALNLSDAQGASISDAAGLGTIRNDDGSTVTSVSPTSGPASGGTSLTISGTGFESNAGVNVGGGAATGVVVGSSTQATATTPALSPGALHNVVVVNPGLTNGTLTNGFFADFLDVPGSHPFHSFIEKLFRNGVTSGCGSGNYCPSASVTRGQMASFLLKAKFGASYDPPDPTQQTFADVPLNHQFAQWIYDLAARGITSGCGGGNYCPESPVTRAQMAALLLKTQFGSSYDPPDPTQQTFADVPLDHPFAQWIYDLAARGITNGCGGGNYCPAQANTRGQMAVFLVRTFNLP